MSARTTEMGEQNDFASFVDQLNDSWGDTFDTGPIGDLAAYDRYVEVHAYQHAFVLDISVVKRRKRSHARLSRRRHQPIPELAKLFDHLVGDREYVLRNGKTERFGGREIDDEIEFRRLLNRKVGWLGPTQNLIDEIASSSKQVRKIGTVGDQGTRVDKFPLARDCRKSCANS
jgi:hypothetical protein